MLHIQERLEKTPDKSFELELQNINGLQKDINFDRSLLSDAASTLRYHLAVNSWRDPS